MKNTPSVVTLAQLCERRGWSNHRARQVLRGAGEERHDGRWQWTTNTIAGVERRLEQLLK